MESLNRIWAFECALQERVAEAVTRFANGTVVACPSIPRVYDANLVRLDRGFDELSGAQIARFADRLQDGLDHRRCVVPDDAAGARLAPEFERLGWRVDRHVTMPYEGNADLPGRDPGVREVADADVAPLRAASSHAGDQMAAFHTRTAAAIETQVFARLADDGSIAAWCSLYREGGIAQIEDVETVARHRRRGFGRAVVGTALATALEAGDDLVFILADESDWPKDWYARMGFVQRARRWLFTRT